MPKLSILDLNTPENYYGSLAPFYDLTSTLVYGGLLQRVNKSSLQWLDIEGKSILIVGGGTGKWLDRSLLKDLAKANKVLFLDSSAEMLGKARSYVKKKHKNSGILFRKIDLFKEESKIEYDIVVVNFVLDCLPDRRITEFMDVIKTHLKPDGVLVVSEFVLDQRNSTFFNRILIRLSYWFFRLMTNISRKSLPQLNDKFSLAGFYLKNVHFWKKGLIRAYYLSVSKAPNQQ